MLCRYDLKLMLFIGVDSENKSIVLAQGFFADEQTASFLWALKHYCNICGGQPEVSKVSSCRNCVFSLSWLLVLLNRDHSLGGVTVTWWDDSPTMWLYRVVIFLVWRNNDDRFSEQ